jgi:DNA-binding NtrC family response regulator
VQLHELPVPDPKDYSALLGSLARVLSPAVRKSDPADNCVCVSSGTAEMRAAWFILTATGYLPATMLQLGSPAEPLFGAANVHEVTFGDGDWTRLRDLVMPMEYFSDSAVYSMRHRLPGPEEEDRLERHDLPKARLTAAPCETFAAPICAEPEAPPADSRLDAALRELDLYVCSPVMRAAAERAAIVAQDDRIPILLTGETGTGKEMFASLVHRLSPRCSRDMVCVNCAAIPKELTESFLFGHVRGAFTGAIQDKRGSFEQAHGSTLFLDEIGELTMEAQAKLLRVLQDGLVEPVGAPAPRQADVRIVAATNRNLQVEIAAGRFREDLFYRLDVVRIELPPLRRRAAEIPELAAMLLKRINQRREHPRQLSSEAIARLSEHSWPGNVRELNNVLQRAALFSRSPVISAGDLELPLRISSSDPFAFLPEPAPGFDLQAFLEEAKRRLVERALEISGGNQSAAATLLGLSKQAVSKMLRRDASDNAD